MPQQQIPTRIIQTGKHTHHPLRERAMTASVRLLNPDFEYLYFDNAAVDEFINREFPEYRQTFDAFRFNIQRYDFFRYLAVFRYGGFYFDLDVLLAASLRELLPDGCVFPFEGLTFSSFLRRQHQMDWQIGNYAFGASPGHPFLRAAIENCVRAQQDPDWVKPMMRAMPALSRNDFLILNTTGPGLLSRTLAENPELARTVTVLFQRDVCDVRTWNRFGDLGIHMMDGSWRPSGGFIRRRITQLWEVRRMARLMRESRRLGKARAHIGPSRLTASE